MSSNSSIVSEYNSFLPTGVTSHNDSTVPSKENRVDSSPKRHIEVPRYSIKVNSVSIYTPDGKVAELSFWRDSSEHNTVAPLEENGGVKVAKEGASEDKIQKTEEGTKGDAQGKLGVKELTNREKEEIRELQRADRKVKMHEMAHMAAGGQYAGGARYAYKTGPGGKRYAVSGEVPIDVSKERDPAKTVQKMSQVKRAALAPADPSAADRAIAAKAAQIMADARLEMIQQQMEERQVRTEEASSDEVNNGIKSYKRHQESTGLNGSYNETKYTGQSSNVISGGIEKLKSSQVTGKSINLFS